jgi:hypothetical protein
VTALQDYYRHKVGQEAFDFFAVFSRFEYAMKFGNLRQDTRPEASWNKLAEALTASFYNAMKAAPEAVIYFTNPPGQLALKDGQVQFLPVDPPRDGVELFKALKRARDNLFHGDKRHDSRRDSDLMIAGLFVLNHAFRTAEAAHDKPALQDFVARMEFGL